MNKGACLKTTVKCSQRQLCCCCCILLLRFYGWAVMLLCFALVGYRQHMLYCEGVPLQIPGTTCGAGARCCCCTLMHRIYGWAVVILVRLLALSPVCDS